MIAFRADLPGQCAAKIPLRAKALEHMREVESGRPAQLAPSPRVDVDAVDPFEQTPAARRNKPLAIGIELPDRTCGILAKRNKMAPVERARRRNDVARESDLMRLVAGEKVGGHDALDVEPGIEHLRVVQ